MNVFLLKLGTGGTVFLYFLKWKNEEKVFSSVRRSAFALIHSVFLILTLRNRWALENILLKTNGARSELECHSPTHSLLELLSFLCRCSSPKCQPPENHKIHNKLKILELWRQFFSFLFTSSSIATTLCISTNRMCSTGVPIHVWAGWSLSA